MNAGQFRAAMAALPEPPNDSAPPHWSFWRHDLWARAQTEPVEAFTEWPCVMHTMLVEHFDLEPQLAYLRSDRARWGWVLDDADRFQHGPERCHARNAANQAYHLKLWEDTTGRRVDRLESIYEFGGGYGAMALVAHRMGFRGQYHIYDLPEFVLLQRWFLDLPGVQVHHTPKRPQGVDLFVALYSISETPPEFRADWLSTCEADSFLFLYSSRFDKWDNAAWMNGLTRAHPEHEWRIVPFPNRPDWYSIGW